MTNNNLPIEDGELISVKLSTHLFSVALALIGILAGLFTYLLGMPNAEKFSIIFYSISGISFLSFVYSIYCGGKGIHRTKKVLTQELSDTSKKNWYNQQSIAGLVGLISMLSLILFYSEKEDKYLLELKELNKSASTIIDDKKSNDEILNRLLNLEIQVDSLKENINRH